MLVAVHGAADGGRDARSGDAWAITSFEIGLYLKILFGLQLPEYLLFALLALVVHVLVNQKYVGHLVAIIAYVFIAVSRRCSGSSTTCSSTAPVRGGPTRRCAASARSLGPWLWFKLYWAAWALLLAVVARLLWVRGRESGLGVRLQLARRRFTRPTAWAAAAAVGLILTLGGFIFYNTNVLNAYRTASDDRGAARRVRAALRAVRGHPAAAADGDQPARRDLSRAAGGGDPRHVPPGEPQRAWRSTPSTWPPRPESRPDAVTFDRPATLALADEELGHRIYALEKPLQPGDSLRLDFEVHVEPRGFREQRRRCLGGGERHLLHERDWLPAIGYQRSRELMSAGDRREHGLAPRPLIPSLDDVEARTDRAAAGIAFEAVVGTDEDQVAVAPGALRRTWTEGGRRYFHYATDAPDRERVRLLLRRLRGA